MGTPFGVVTSSDTADMSDTDTRSVHTAEPMHLAQSVTLQPDSSRLQSSINSGYRN